MKYLELDIKIADDVYPPSEDTFLLLEAIQLSTNDTFLEVGCGSGIIAITASKIAKRVIAIDSSLAATHNTYQNVQRNETENIEVIQGNLLSAISPDTKFSVIAFNPPYLPRDADTSTLDFAVIGGINGTEIAEDFIEQGSKHLDKTGSIYIVASSLTDIKRLEKKMHDNNLSVEKIASRKFFFEEIIILKGVKDYKESVL